MMNDTTVVSWLTHPLAVSYIENEIKKRNLPLLFFGQNQLFYEDMSKECMLSGPAETGKTMTCLHRLMWLMWQYPKAQGAMVRKTYASMHATVLQTWRSKIMPINSPVSPYGGKKPIWYDYPNGSRLHVAGLDNPDRLMSGEFDFVYVNQAEELTEEDWEKLLTRTTGRSGNAPHAQLFGDCNPDIPEHWIPQRRDMGHLRMYESRHVDNPVLYDQLHFENTGERKQTKQGVITINTLDRLTGARKERLRYGRWVRAEGVVYNEFDASIHVLEPFSVDPSWRRIRSIDFGYRNPFVCQWWAIDGDGRMYLYRELYMTHRIVSEHLVTIQKNSKFNNGYPENYQVTVADHAAEDRATLLAGVDLYDENGNKTAIPGIETEPAYKGVESGIKAVKARLKVQPDGRPRLFMLRDVLIERDERLHEARRPLGTLSEMAGYVWDKNTSQRRGNKPPKEVPIKEDDHGMDAMRYAVAWVDGLGDGSWSEGPLDES